MDYQQTFSTIEAGQKQEERIAQIAKKNNQAAKVILAFMFAVICFLGGIAFSAFFSSGTQSFFGNFFALSSSTNNSSAVVVNGSKTTASSSDLGIKNDRFNSVLKILQDKYVENNIDVNKLYEGAIKGMVDSLGDPYTVYFSAKETSEYNESLSGKFEGIGAELGYLDGWIIVKRTFTDSPAEKFGLKAGDYIGKVDDYNVKKNDNISDVVMKIRGEGGTEVKLTVYASSAGDGERVVNIVRGPIITKSMELIDQGNGIWRIQLSRFTDSSFETFITNWQNLTKELASKNPSKIILDLRGNGGGYLEGAVYIAEDFLQKDQVILHVAGKNGIEKTYFVKRNGVFTNIPLEVLQNENSASASEILIGALKGNGRGKFIGSHTFGKGIAQIILADPSWSGASLHVTVQKWLLPDKTQINKDNTIKPDIEIIPTIDDIRAGKDIVLEKALASFE